MAQGGTADTGVGAAAKRGLRQTGDSTDYSGAAAETSNMSIATSTSACSTSREANSGIGSSANPHVCANAANPSESKSSSQTATSQNTASCGQPGQSDNPKVSVSCSGFARQPVSAKPNAAAKSGPFLKPIPGARPISIVRPIKSVAAHLGVSPELASAAFHHPIYETRRGFQGLRSRMSRNFPPNLARLMLLCCAALWGGSYLVAKVAMTAISPQWLMGLRTGGACVVMLILFHRSIIPALNRHMIVPALVVGVTYYGTMVMQTYGLKTIDPGRSAFLTAAYCVLTPFVAWLVVKRRPYIINLLAGVICLLGVGFIALKPGSVSLALSQGDLLTIGCSVVFSFNLTYLGIYSKRFNAIAVTFLQFAVACVLFLAGAVLTEPAPSMAWLKPSIVVSFIYLFLGATTLAQIMQNVGLAHVSAASASIVLCTESLFSELFSIVFWHAQVSLTLFIGFALIFCAVLLSILHKSMFVSLVRRVEDRVLK
ncbi:DMT family transporter [Bifidobacterium sp. ESL0790]|uniref:DMT family transporter n=1 Tax=Bifidobacterium sp. ESL0790 TaxID=2983233 RepID=UPI0023FA18F6|nr:DMT family transporter [Bifidobacterium sp. ESL0790]WEV71776.1 DMT family transporter [Bifidobacterium sp. ESL0790]